MMSAFFEVAHELLDRSGLIARWFELSREFEFGDRLAQRKYRQEKPLFASSENAVVRANKPLTATLKNITLIIKKGFILTQTG